MRSLQAREAMVFLILIGITWLLVRQPGPLRNRPARLRDAPRPVVGETLHTWLFVPPWPRRLLVLGSVVLTLVGLFVLGQLLWYQPFVFYPIAGAMILATMLVVGYVDGLPRHYTVTTEGVWIQAANPLFPQRYGSNTTFLVDFSDVESMLQGRDSVRLRTRRRPGALGWVAALLRGRPLIEIQLAGAPAETKATLIERVRSAAP